MRSSVFEGGDQQVADQLLELAADERDADLDVARDGLGGAAAGAGQGDRAAQVAGLAGDLHRQVGTGWGRSSSPTARSGCGRRRTWWRRPGCRWPAGSGRRRRSCPRRRSRRRPRSRSRASPRRRARGTSGRTASRRPRRAGRRRSSRGGSSWPPSCPTPGRPRYAPRCDLRPAAPHARRPARDLPVGGGVGRRHRRPLRRAGRAAHLRRLPAARQAAVRPAARVAPARPTTSCCSSPSTRSTSSGSSSCSTRGPPPATRCWRPTAPGPATGSGGRSTCCSGCTSSSGCWSSRSTCWRP